MEEGEWRVSCLVRVVFAGAAPPPFPPLPLPQLLLMKPPASASTSPVVQDAMQRSIDRCVDAENEAENLRARVAEMEQREDSAANRNTLAALETRVDELEEECRRAAASKADTEVEARQSANRAKRLLGEVEMMRSEYEVVSEEAMGLRGSLAATEVCVCCLLLRGREMMSLVVVCISVFAGKGGRGE